MRPGATHPIWPEGRRCRGRRHRGRLAGGELLEAAARRRLRLGAMLVCTSPWVSSGFLYPASNACCTATAEGAPLLGGGGDGGGLGLDVRVEVRRNDGHPPSSCTVDTIGMRDIENTPTSRSMLSVFIQQIQSAP